MENYKLKSVKELKEICKKNKIKNYSKLKKNDLIKLLINYTQNIKDDSNQQNIDENIDKNNEQKIVEQDNKIIIENIDGIQLLNKIDNNSIDLILTDPPYIISKESGMDKHYNNVKNNEGTNMKNEDDWLKYKKLYKLKDDSKKENYIKYGSIYGKKYCVKTDYGDWDQKFTMEILENYIKNYYDKLKQGGTIIIFFDLWKISYLKDLLEKYKFKQIRFIEWIKTNPQPRNSKVNYLTNAREIALLAVKGSNPTFNSSYDKGIYEFPLEGGKNRFHPTQKSLNLFKELILKHSNENDTILDTFLGSGTTAIASKQTNRNFIGCELNKEYFNKIFTIL